MNSILLKLIDWLPKVLGPSSIAAAFLYIINNKREVTISLEFLEYEMDNGKLLLVLILGAVLLLVLSSINISFRNSFRANIFALKQYGLNIPVTGLVLFLSGIIIYLTLDMRKRYNHFSQAHHHEYILEQIQKGEYRKATSAAQKYLWMYPQRLPEKLDDPLINPMLDLNKAMARYRNTSQSLNEISPTRLNEYDIPVLSETRSYAYELFDQMSGGIIVDE